MKKDLNANGDGGDVLMVLDGHVDVHDGDPRIDGYGGDEMPILVMPAS